MQDWAGHFNGKCISKEYRNIDTPLTWRCEKGHIFDAPPSIIKQGGWCRQCLNTPRKWTLSDMKALAKKSGGRCLSKEYKRLSSKLKWKCAKGHVWEAMAQSIIRNSWCPECFGNKKKDFSFYQNLAKEKGGKCLSIKYVNAKTKLKWRCKKGHIWKAAPCNIRRGWWCPYCGGTAKLSIKRMHAVARSRKGKCLSTQYINNRTKLLWQCAKEHTWEATPTDVMDRRSWCPHCAKNKKHTIEEMQQLAASRNGKCLSEKYVNKSTKLLWQCSEGHTWQTSPGSVLNSNSWCPKCRNLRRSRQ